MNESFNEQVFAIYNDAIERLESERDRYVIEVTANNDALRRQVRSFLDAHRKAEHTTFLRPRSDAIDADQSLIGEQIGKYTIVSVLGEGGMGTVYRATQKQPTRDVALKLLRFGFTSSRMRRRFEFEAETLARLQHPHIAQIFESGTAAQRKVELPFIAMELVEGSPLIEFVNSNRPSIRERVRLMIKICQAVNHAHQKGVIHRDIKPANILIAPSGDPKILDFGVARVIDESSGLSQSQTMTGQLIGTFQYMSPEQYSGDTNDIDTRTDVYSLGVICHELLIGQLPYDTTGKRIDEIASLVCRDHTNRVKTTSRSLPYDLTTVLLKALSVNKTRRYQSASELADDLQSYLEHKPIAAGRSSVIYRSQMFVRRKPGLCASALIAIVALAVVAIALYVAHEQSELARARNDVVTSFASVDKALPRDASPQTLDRFRKAVMDLDAIVDFDVLTSDLAWRLHNRLATLYSSAGCLDRTLEHRKSALVIRSNLSGPTHQLTLWAVQVLAETMLLDGQFAEAEKFLFEHLEYLETDDSSLIADENLDGPMKQRILRARWTFAAAKNTLGKHDEAEKIYWSILADQRTMAVNDSTFTNHLDTMDLLGDVIALDQTRLAEAEAVLRGVLTERRIKFGMSNMQAVRTMSRLGHVLSLRGEYGEAESLLEEAAARQRDNFGERHAATLRTAIYLEHCRCFATEDRSLERFASLIDDAAKNARLAWNLPKLRDLYAQCLDRHGRYEEAERQRSIPAIRIPSPCCDMN